MRYLYGDSVPFPPQYDFLAALDAFCTHAAIVVRVDAEARRLKQTTEDAGAARLAAVDRLDAFHREAVGALKDGVEGNEEPLVHDYVRQLGELAQRIVDETRRMATSANEREQEGARAEQDRRRAESRDALEKLLVAVSLPPIACQVRMSLGAPPSPSYDASATLTFEGGLVASLTLAREAVEEWRAPRRVGDLVTALTLPVGVRRSLFKRTVAPETITLDDYLIGGFDLREDGADLQLRKKAELPDSLVFTLKKPNGELRAEVHYPADADAEMGLPALLDPSSAEEVEKLWQRLRAAVDPLLAKRKQLLSLTLGGVDVLSSGLGTSVVSFMVAAIAPIVQEVARRSPNTQELSLKLENETGRREEIYLKKAQLVAALSTAPSPERNVFDPLELLDRATVTPEIPVNEAPAS